MKSWRLPLLAAIAGLTGASAMPAGTFTVVNTAASGAGSLAQAIEDANAAAGKDTIDFDIPGAGPHTIDCGASPLPPITGPVDIDGTTQNGHAGTPVIVVRGEHNLQSIGLDVQGGNSTLRALAVTRWGVGIRLFSGNNTVQDCYVGVDETGDDVGLTKLDDNLVGIRIASTGGPASNNQILDNLVSANGTGVHLLAGDSAQILGNRIGCNAAGTHVLGNAVGILLAGSTQASIGNGTAAGRNAISGNGFGIQITGGSGAQIRGNFIGPNLAGTGPLIRFLPGPPPFMDTAGNFLDGILVNVPAGNPILIGGAGALAASDGNRIAYNRRNGVRVQQGTGAAIRGNSIHSNAPAPPSTASAIGINLVGGELTAASEVTPIDTCDADEGPNHHQNFPALSSATSGGGVTVVEGTLEGSATTTYQLDFFSSAQCDPSGFGEGQTFLGSTSVTTDASCQGDFTAQLSDDLAPGTIVTATATDPAGNTSEFSLCETVTGSPAVVPALVLVDAAASATSDGNFILEPGETATAEPFWRNVSSSPVALTGTASNFTGPAGPVYTITDSAAAYGTIASGATGGCSASANCFGLGVNAVLARPSTHWDARFTETPSTGDPPKTWTVHIGASFADVLPPSSGNAPSAGNPFYLKIETLLHSGITQGVGPTTFGPGDAVTRAQMVIFIARALLEGAAIPQSGNVGAQPYNCAAGGTSIYTDVLPTDIFCRAAHYLASRNVTLGCGGTLFCGAEDVTRDAMAAFIARALVAPGGGAAVPGAYGPDPITGLSYDCNLATASVNFADVPAAHSFCKHVHYLWALGIIAGCGGNQYCPAGLVTRDAMAKFLANAFQLALSGP